MFSVYFLYSAIGMNDNLAVKVHQYTQKYLAWPRPGFHND